MGDTYQGFTVLRITPIPEFSINAIYLKHAQLGTEWLHLDVNDINNAFAITFMTPPEDSTGLPHILEHVTLCGSHRYPVRDPFFAMAKRSLNTYMNAWTASDHTSYPFSTQSPSDFANLMSVYLDATLSPLLRDEDFLQEGIRLDLDHQPVPSFKGVVFNEMKGALAEPGSLLAESISALVFDRLVKCPPYRFVSGGEPLDMIKSHCAISPSTASTPPDPAPIPTLNRDRLAHFHSKHYRLDNARVYTYGDIPLETHLDTFIQQLPPSAVAAITSTTDNTTATNSQPATRSFLNDQRLISGELQKLIEGKADLPIRSVIHGPPDPRIKELSRQTQIAVAYLLNTIVPEENAPLGADEDVHYLSFALDVVCDMLTDNPRGPFYKSLIESGLAPDLLPNTGYDHSIKYATYVIGVQNVSGAQPNIDRILATISNTFARIARNGFDAELIESTLHSIELGIKTISPHFGLNLVNSLIPLWIHGSKPETALFAQQYLDRLRYDIASNPTFFQDLVRTWFVQNNRCIQVIQQPDVKFFEKREKQEQSMLKLAVSSMTETEKSQLREKTAHLAEAQQAGVHQDLSCLPTLKTSDISRVLPDPENIVTRPSTNPQFDTIFTETRTNGVVYMRVLTRIHPLRMPRELAMYLPLFALLLSRLGARDLSPDQLSNQIEKTTGGIESSGLVRLSDLSDPNRFEWGLMTTSHCLERNVLRMFDLISAIYTEPQLLVNVNPRFEDQSRKYLASLIEQAALSAIQSMTNNSQIMSLASAARGLTRASHVDELLCGISSVNFLNAVAQAVRDGKLDQVLENLKMLGRVVLSGNTTQVLVTAEPNRAERSLDIAQQVFLNSLPSELYLPSKHDLDEDTSLSTSFNELGIPHIYHVVPSPVNAVTAAIYSCPFNHPDHALLCLGANLLNSSFLHHEIREKGGAYGTSCTQTLGGLFALSSFRDPNIAATLDVFDRAVNWSQFDEKKLDEAKLLTFQQLDAPTGPSSKGVAYMLYGITNEVRQARRDQILNAKPYDVGEVLHKYLSIVPRDRHVLPVKDADTLQREKGQAKLQQPQSPSADGLPPAKSRNRLGFAVLGNESGIPDFVRNSAGAWMIDNPQTDADTTAQGDQTPPQKPSVANLNPTDLDMMSPEMISELSRLLSLSKEQVETANSESVVTRTPFAQRGQHGIPEPPKLKQGATQKEREETLNTLKILQTMLDNAAKKK